jgi:hypothetical protein
MGVPVASHSQAEDLDPGTIHSLYDSFQKLHLLRRGELPPVLTPRSDSNCGFKFESPQFESTSENASFPSSLSTVPRSTSTVEVFILCLAQKEW